MAEGIEVLRRQYRRVVTGTMGRAPDNRRGLHSELGWDGLEAGLLALPADITALSRLQDPVTGALPFQFDFSSFDGPDPWA
jgi:hypothetical protein